VMTPEDLLRCDIIQQLTCYRELDIACLEEQYGINFEEHFAGALPSLDQLAEDGLIQRDKRRLVISAKGSLLLRAICMVFDETLGHSGQTSRFSRVI